MGRKDGLNSGGHSPDCQPTEILDFKSRPELVHAALQDHRALKRFKKLMKKHAGKLEFAGLDRNP
jgi:hypothetical protein